MFIALEITMGSELAFSAHDVVVFKSGQKFCKMEKGMIQRCPKRLWCMNMNSTSRRFHLYKSSGFVIKQETFTTYTYIVVTQVQNNVYTYNAGGKS